MLRERRSPSYDLREVKDMVAKDAVLVRRRPERFVINHFGALGVKDICKRVVEAIEEGDFYKSVELEFVPGEWADVYRGVRAIDLEDGGDGWYVKFAIVGGEALVSFLSLNWDGYIH